MYCGEKGDHRMYYRRTLTSTIQRASAAFPVVLVTGPRQVGKTTLLEHAAKQGRAYVTLDDPQVRLLAKTDPALFFQTYHTPLLIDEIQYAQELFPYIKMIADREKTPGLFWLTGSQQFHLMKGVTESLAGRVAVLDLQGLSQAEKSGRPNTPPFLPGNRADPQSKALALRAVYELIVKGSFPALFEGTKLDRELFYASYLRTYLERDVRDLLKITDESNFVQFMKAAAARTGQLLNYSDLARDVDVSQNTVKAWLSVLQTSGLVYLLQPYFNNLTSRLIKTPKLYFMDTGLCCYLTGWRTAETLESGAMNGALFETYVVTEIIKSYWHHGRQAPVYFYRDKEMKEIDLVIEENGTLYPIEIKKTASPGSKDIRSFSVLQRQNTKVGHGAVICLAQRRLPITREVDSVPIGEL